uniref:Thioredoxin domain-containing protein n=1 Tax=viral metagenome TaxID=1070528 RepID=A0A6C0JIZ2_9ZZZZ
MDILYYSNYCKHCQKLVQTLVKGNMSDKISFICIDKRTRDPKNGQQYIVLENGSKVIMPPNIHSVPSLLLIKQSYRVLLGDEIMKHFHPQLKQLSEKATNFQGEPASFSLANFGTIVSEQYTNYNMSPEELSAKGKGANRPLFNYVSAADDIHLINTPPDTYRPDKLSQNVTIDTLQQQRLDEIGPINRPVI